MNDIIKNNEGENGKDPGSYPGGKNAVTKHAEDTGAENWQHYSVLDKVGIHTPEIGYKIMFQTPILHQTIP